MTYTRNPYHDSKGRFTSSPGGLSKRNRSGVRKGGGNPHRDKRTGAYISLGLSKGKWKKIKNFSICHLTAKQFVLAKVAFQVHRAGAKMGGIGFYFSFEQWVGVWEISLGPQWLEKRGQGKDKFCMARFYDSGAYEIGNVKIITNSENSREIKSNRLHRERPI